MEGYKQLQEPTIDYCNASNKSQLYIGEMETIAQRIAKARELKGLNQSELARELGISPQAVQNWEAGKSSPRGARIREVAKALGLTIEHLLFGNDKTGVITASSSLDNVSPAPDIKGVVPLISWVQAGNWQETIDNLQPGDAEMWLPLMGSGSKSTYALRVRGISMENPNGKPSYSDGDIIYVDPERAANHRDRVVVRLDDESESTFKQLLIEGDQQFLKALNPDWPGPKLIEITSSATICGVVIGKWVPE